MWLQVNSWHVKIWVHIIFLTGIELKLESAECLFRSYCKSSNTVYWCLWLLARPAPPALLTPLCCHPVFQWTHGLGAARVRCVPDAPRQPEWTDSASPVRLLPGAPGASPRRCVAMNVCPNIIDGGSCKGQGREDSKHTGNESLKKSILFSLQLNFCSEWHLV